MRSYVCGYLTLRLFEFYGAECIKHTELLLFPLFYKPEGGHRIISVIYDES